MGVLGSIVMSEKNPVKNAMVAKEEFDKCGSLKDIRKVEENRYRMTYNLTGFNHGGFGHNYSITKVNFWEHDGNLIMTASLWGEYDCE